MRQTSCEYTPPAADAAQTDGASLIPSHIWVRIGILAALFLALHHDIFYRLGRFAWTDGDWSHAFLVPLFSAYFISQRRQQLQSITPKRCDAGLAVMVIAMIGYGAAVYPIRSDMLKGYMMIAELFGLVLYLVGPAMMRVLWLPIVFLAFAVKIDDRIWDAIAWKMQLIAASSSVAVMNLLGMQAQVTETTIELWRGIERVATLNVAQACSGMRMLMTFIALGVAVAYLWDRPWWARLTMVVMTVPIAIAVNVGRVTTLGLLHLVDPSYSAGDFHIFLGMVMLLPALGLFLLVGWVLQRVSGEKATEKGGPLT